MHEIVAAVSATAHAPPAQVFQRILAADTRTLFTGHGPVAAVSGISAQDGPWDRAGRTRVVSMSDGSRHLEELVYVDPPRGFGFALREVGGPLGWLTHGARGHWRFEALGPDRTRVHWQYVFEARDAVPYAVGWLLLRVLWAAYMRAALRRAIEQASGPA